MARTEELEPAPPLIPIRYRQPIARDLSHPIGAEQLSEALAGVSQFEALTVSFSGVPNLWADTRPDKSGVSEIDPQPVLSAWFTNRRPGVSGSPNLQSAEFGERWGLTVYPVPSGLKATVRAALGANGIPAVREWLAEPRTETWRGALRHEIEVLYDFETRVMSWRVEP
ncbi:MAG: hypothetical protein ABJC13_01910 [Acidobacteriota bacterium]